MQHAILPKVSTAGPPKEPLYVPLPTDDSHIRLIKLCPAARNTPVPSGQNPGVRCKMHAYSFDQLEDSRLKYHALSYAWGDAEAFYPFSIPINDHLVEITKGLGTALQALAGAEDEFLIWIDALCINQADVAELIAWLGPSDDSSTMLFDLMDSYDVYPLKHRRPRLGARAWSAPEVSSQFEIFARRPYWQRAWIRQELQLAKRVTILCGDEVASANFINLFPTTIDGSLDKPTQIMAWIIRSIGEARSPALRTPVYDVLIRYGQGRCSVKRDRIYALLGIAKPNLLELGFRVDYQMPYEKLVKLLAHCIFYPTVVLETERALFELGDKDCEETAGFSAPVNVLLDCARYFSLVNVLEYKDRVSWAHVMDLPYDQVREHFLGEHTTKREECSVCSPTPSHLIAFRSKENEKYRAIALKIPVLQQATSGDPGV